MDASAILSAEQQAHIAARHAQDTWAVDTAHATVTLTAPDGSRLTCRAHFLGTSAPGPNTWLWGWRNINRFPAEFVALAERVRAAGEEQGIAELATAEVPLADDLPRRVTLAAKSITGLAAHYSGPIGGGSRAWLLIEHPDLELPPPTAQATADAILSAVETVGIADHAEALASWARRRGVVLAGEDVAGSGMRLTLPDGEVVVTFDHQHRIMRVEQRAPVGLDGSIPLHERAVAEPEPEHGPVAGPEPLIRPEPPPEPAGAPRARPERESAGGESGRAGIDELLAAAEAPQGEAADTQEGEPESPMRRFWDFLRGPKP